MSLAQTEQRPAPQVAIPAVPSARLVLPLGVLGAYVNAVAYGFGYGQLNHEFDLPLVHWLRDPSLYPHDPIKEAFARHPTVFWPIVAQFSNWFQTETVVFMFFVLTKLLFFTALARIVGARVKDRLLATCIVLAVALSPFFNDLTPLGGSDVLNSVETHASLAVALLLWAGCFLLEERWLAASALCALTSYVDALFFVHTIFAFVAFAVFDWPRQRSAIVRAGLLGAALSLPWLLLGPGVTYYPTGYVEALLAFFPFHLTLRGDDLYDLLSGGGLVVAAVGMAVVARRAGARRDFRFELLTASFMVPVLLGAFFGQFYLTPTLARLQLLRADSFLLLYSILLVQIYGASLLSIPSRDAGKTLLLCAMAILLPLSDLVGLLWPLFIAMFLWTRSANFLEGFWRAASRSRMVQAAGLVLLLAGITAAGLPQADWSTTLVIVLTILGGCLFVYDRGAPAPHARLMKLAAGVCGAAFLMVAAGTVPRLSSFWNPAVQLTPLEADWRAVQFWARANTPRDAQFLVPTYPSGFRAFSERSSWGEWKDGNIAYFYPPFAEMYRQRMVAVGHPWGTPWRGTPTLVEDYRRLPPERLLEIARDNHLNYIVAFRDRKGTAAPVFSNSHFAVYKVSP